MGNARKSKSDSCHLLEMAFLGDPASNFYLTVAVVIRILSDGWIKDYIFVTTNSFVEPCKKIGHSLSPPQETPPAQPGRLLKKFGSSNCSGAHRPPLQW